MEEEEEEEEVVEERDWWAHEVAVCRLQKPQSSLFSSALACQV